MALLRWAILAIAVLPFVYYLAATFCAWDFFRRRREVTADFSPPVSVLKPLEGLEHEAYENLASFCRQDYPEYEILFAVDDGRDPAIPIIEKLISDFPSVPIRLLVGSGTPGSNNKVAKLCRLGREARHELLVVSDSDIRVKPDYLRRVVSPFRDPSVGAVTCLYVGMTEPNLWSELEDLNLTSDLLASMLVARKLEGMNFALGATMAVTRSRLAEIGGFEALADCAADDHELGRRIAARGYRVELAPCAVQTLLRFKHGPRVLSASPAVGCGHAPLPALGVCRTFVYTGLALVARGSRGGAFACCSHRLPGHLPGNPPGHGSYLRRIRNERPAPAQKMVAHPPVRRRGVLHLGGRTLFGSCLLAGVEVLCPAGPPDPRNPTSRDGAHAAGKSTMNHCRSRGSPLIILADGCNPKI